MSDFYTEQSEPQVEVQPAAPQSKGKCIAGMILGISGLVCGCIAWLPASGWVFGIIGIIVSAIGIGLSKKGLRNCTGGITKCAKAGKVCGILGLIFSIIGTIVSIALTVLLFTQSGVDYNDIMNSIYY